MAYIAPNPNGSATSANSAPVVIASDQATIKTKLANDIAQTTGTITTAASVVTTGALSGVGSATVQISGTYAGVNVTFEASVDNTNWVGIPAVQLASANPTATLTSGVLTNNTVIWNIGPLLGVQYIRVRATAWTSGTANIIIQPSAQFAAFNVNAIVTSAPTTAVTLATNTPTLQTGANIVGKVGIDQTTPGTTNLVQVGGSLPAGTNTVGAVKITDGTNTAAVKAASTAPIATDPATVVAISPNSPAHPVTVSGTAAISAASLPLPTGAALDATLTGGTARTKITDGTNNAAVKAASTAAVSTDPAMVVAISPNNPITVSGTSDGSASISIAATATSSGQIVGANSASTGTIQLTGTWVATVQVQVQADGSTWTNITGSNVIVNAATGAYVASGNLTANGVYQLDIAGFAGIRVITTAWTSGTITGTVRSSTGAGSVSIDGTPTVIVSGTVPVSMATNTPVIATGTNSIGTVQPGNTANTTPWLQRQAATTTSSTLLVNKVLAAAATTPVQIKTTAGALYGWHFVNNATTTRYIRFFNVSSAPTMGTTSPTFVIPLPGSGGAVLPVADINIPMATGIFYAITAAAADLDNTAPAANDVVGTIFSV